MSVIRFVENRENVEKRLSKWIIRTSCDYCKYRGWCIDEFLYEIVCFIWDEAAKSKKVKEIRELYDSCQLRMELDEVLL